MPLKLPIAPQVMGVTDVDDKIINRAKADGQVGTKGAAGLAGKYEKLFLKDMRLLGVLPPDSLTRVSEFIPDIVAFIADLERLKFAYVGSGSGTVQSALPDHHFETEKLEMFAHLDTAEAPRRRRGHCIVAVLSRHRARRHSLVRHKGVWQPLWSAGAIERIRMRSRSRRG